MPQLSLRTWLKDNKLSSYGCTELLITMAEKIAEIDLVRSTPSLVIITIAEKCDYVKYAHPDTWLILNPTNTFIDQGYYSDSYNVILQVTPISNSSTQNLVENDNTTEFYLAPECKVINGDPFNYAAHAYALGVLAIEIYAGKPMETLISDFKSKHSNNGTYTGKDTTDADILKILVDEHVKKPPRSTIATQPCAVDMDSTQPCKNDINEEILEKLRTVIKSLLNNDPQKRGSIKDILAALTGYRDELKRKLSDIELSPKLKYVLPTCLSELYNNRFWPHRPCLPYPLASRRQLLVRSRGLTPDHVIEYGTTAQDTIKRTMYNFITFYYSQHDGKTPKLKEIKAALEYYLAKLDIVRIPKPASVATNRTQSTTESIYKFISRDVSKPTEKNIARPNEEHEKEPSRADKIKFCLIMLGNNNPSRQTIVDAEWGGYDARWSRLYNQYQYNVAPSTTAKQQGEDVASPKSRI